MTKQEAQALWDARGPQWEIKPTVEQDAYVLAFWDRMPNCGCRTWMEAFITILHGEEAQYGGAPTDSEIGNFLPMAQRRAEFKTIPNRWYWWK